MLSHRMRIFLIRRVVPHSMIGSIQSLTIVRTISV